MTMINRPVKCNTCMPCNHPGCQFEVSPDKAMFLDLDTIDEMLGRPAKLSDLHRYAVHASHGYGTTCEYLVTQIAARQSAPTVKIENKYAVRTARERAYVLSLGKYDLPTERVNRAGTLAVQQGIPIEKALANVARTARLVSAQRAKALSAQLSA